MQAVREVALIKIFKSLQPAQPRTEYLIQAQSQSQSPLFSNFF